MSYIVAYYISILYSYSYVFVILKNYESNWLLDLPYHNARTNSLYLISLGFRTNRSKANIPFKTLNSVQIGSKYENVKHSHTKLFAYLFKH